MDFLFVSFRIRSLYYSSEVNFCLILLVLFTSGPWIKIQVSFIVEKGIDRRVVNKYGEDGRTGPTNTSKTRGHNKLRVSARNDVAGNMGHQFRRT